MWETVEEDDEDDDDEDDEDDEDDDSDSNDDEDSDECSGSDCTDSDAASSDDDEPQNNGRRRRPGRNNRAQTDVQNFLVQVYPVDGNVSSDQMSQVVNELVQEEMVPRMSSGYDNEFAQAQGSHGCTTAIDRAKSSKKASDFPADYDSIRWDDKPGALQNMKKDAKKASWKSASSSGASLWGTAGVQPQDAEQGKLGDCWFVAAMSATAEKSKRIKDRVKKSGSGYKVTMYPIGIPTEVVVDDKIPF